jgi:RNA polymerase sigma factor (sigma-70 family)
MEHFTKLIRKESYRFKNQFPFISYEVEDLIQEGILKIYTAAEKYDSNKAAPSTFITRILRNHFLNITRIERGMKWNEDCISDSIPKNISPPKLQLLSETAQAFFRAAMELPEGLQLLLQPHPRCQFPEKICEYLHYPSEEIEHFKEELRSL